MGPMERARKIVENHISIHGAIKGGSELIDAIAADLGFVQLASIPHRDDSKPMTDVQAARYVVQTHGSSPGEGEKPENFVLRIVQAYDRVKSPNWPADRAKRWPGNFVRDAH